MQDKPTSAALRLESFFRQYRHLRYKKGETVLYAGDDAPGAFMLVHGYVRLYSISKEGEELTLIVYKPGDIFPMLLAVSNVPNPYYIETVTPCELYRAPKDEFLSFIKSNGDVLFELTKRVLIRLGGLLSRMEYLAFGNAYQKIASILHICAERFGEESGTNIIVQVPLTHKDVANFVGVTRETASIEIKKLERKGIITFRGRHVVVKNLSNLRRESLLEEQS